MSAESEHGGGYALPRGLRDTRQWYGDAAALEQVDSALVDFVSRNAGHRVLDLGCGIGGYSRVLADRGFEMVAFDVVPEYVERARGLGVDAHTYDGERVPLPDGAVDTVIALEVLEHLDDPGRLVREARRLARRNVLVTTPNCTQSFGRVPIEFSHMLDVDHRQFFTAASLGDLLAEAFARHEVVQTYPLDEGIGQLVLPRRLHRLHGALLASGVLRSRYFFRLLGQGWVDPGGPR